MSENTELFSGKTNAYADGRPGYPAAAIDYIAALVPEGAVFADFGAGTGKFTELIAQRGYPIIAIEPNEEMREHLETTLAPYANAKIVNGTAEESTLPHQSVDVIASAQALHWFDLDAFRTECRRIAKPGAIVIAVYNGSDFPKGRITAEAFFENITMQEFPNPQYYTREGWVKYMTSHASDPLPSDPRYEAHIKRVNEVFDRDSENGLLHRPVETQVYHEV